MALHPYSFQNSQAESNLGLWPAVVPIWKAHSSNLCVIPFSVLSPQLKCLINNNKNFPDHPSLKQKKFLKTLSTLPHSLSNCCVLFSLQDLSGIILCIYLHFSWLFVASTGNKLCEYKLCVHCTFSNACTCTTDDFLMKKAEVEWGPIRIRRNSIWMRSHKLGVGTELKDAVECIGCVLCADTDTIFLSKSIWILDFEEALIEKGSNKNAYR